MFIRSVIDSARKDFKIDGLLYQNDVESLHRVEKCIQGCKKCVTDYSQLEKGK